MCGTKCLTVLAVLTALLGYGVYRPVPDEFTEPWKSRIILASMDAVGHVSWIGEMLGLGKSLDIYRGIMETTTTMFGFEHHGLKVTNTTFDGIPVRIYEPEETAKSKLRPAVVFYHGGGFYFGSINTHDSFTAELARRSQAVVVSVEYRLAPEHPYPAGVEDCFKATLHFMLNAASHGVDKNNILVAGDSAGGNLATVISMKLRAKGASSPQPKAQILIYPCLQMFDFKLPSMLQNDDFSFVTRRFMAQLYVQYIARKKDSYLVDEFLNNNHTSIKLKKEFNKVLDIKLLPKKYLSDYKPDTADYGNDKLSSELEKALLDPFISPAIANNLAGMPQAFVQTMETDPLRDEGIIYAKRLEQAGVKVTLNNSVDGFHSAINFVSSIGQLKSGIDILNNVVKFIQSVV